MKLVIPLAGLSAAALTFGLATAAPAGAATATLLSQGKTVTASSVQDAYTPAKAVDGNTATRWGSAYVDPAWIQVDLGAVDSISRVQLNWEVAYGKAYQVQTSTDAKTWTTVYKTTTGNGGSDNLTGLSGKGRYVRINATKRGTQWGYSLWEFQVFGTAAAATSTPTPTPTGSTTATAAGLDDPHEKDIAMQLVSSAENSSLDWKAQYSYIEDIGDGRGYTGGIIGFCSGTSDMLALVKYYTVQEPGNGLAKYLPALEAVDGTDSHAGLGTAFVTAWKAAAKDTVFQAAQNEERDRVYFNPSVQQAKDDGLRALGQFAYYDAIVMHGPGNSSTAFGGIRKTAMKNAKTPAQGGDETTYLNAFLDARKAAMLTEAAHDDTSRVDTEQRVFLQAGNLDLLPPLSWKTYGDSYKITS